MFMSWMDECQPQKHTQHASCPNSECDYLHDIQKNLTWKQRRRGNRIVSLALAKRDIHDDIKMSVGRLGHVEIQNHFALLTSYIPMFFETINIFLPRQSCQCYLPVLK